MPRLTKRLIESSPPQARRYILWDEALPGLGVEVFPSGTRTFLLNYRTQAGDQRRIKLGRYLPPRYTADTARAVALAKLAEIQAGVDPRADAKAKRREPTVGQLIDRYLADHVDKHNKPRTQRRVEQLVRLRIRPALGNLRLSALTPNAIRQWHASMAATPTDANRALAALRKALSLAVIDWEILQANPARGIKPYAERQGTRIFIADELIRIREVLAEVEAAGTILPGVIRAVRILALTGLRTAEVLALKWQDVNVGGRTATLQDAKTGTRTVPLGRLAIVVMGTMPPSGGYVVNAGDPTKPLSESTLRHAWSRIRQRSNLGRDTGLHTFRRTAATMAAQAGASAFALRDAFGWKGLAMPGRYVQRAAAEGVPDMFGAPIGAALGINDVQNDAVVLPLGQVQET